MRDSYMGDPKFGF